MSGKILHFFVTYLNINRKTFQMSSHIGHTLMMSSWSLLAWSFCQSDKKDWVLPYDVAIEDKHNHIRFDSTHFFFGPVAVLVARKLFSDKEISLPTTTPLLPVGIEAFTRSVCSSQASFRQCTLPQSRKSLCCKRQRKRKRAAKVLFALLPLRRLRSGNFALMFEKEACR